MLRPRLALAHRLVLPTTRRLQHILPLPQHMEASLPRQHHRRTRRCLQATHPRLQVTRLPRRITAQLHQLTEVRHVRRQLTHQRRQHIVRRHPITVQHHLRIRRRRLRTVRPVQLLAAAVLVNPTLPLPQAIARLRRCTVRLVQRKVVVAEAGPATLLPLLNSHPPLLVQPRRSTLRRARNTHQRKSCIKFISKILTKDGQFSSLNLISLKGDSVPFIGPTRSANVPKHIHQKRTTTPTTTHQGMAFWLALNHFSISKHDILRPFSRAAFCRTLGQVACLSSHLTDGGKEK